MKRPIMQRRTRIPDWHWSTWMISGIALLALIILAFAILLGFLAGQQLLSRQEQANIHLQLAAEYHQAGDLELAAAEYGQAIKINPDNYGAVTNLEAILQLIEERDVVQDNTQNVVTPISTLRMPLHDISADKETAQIPPSGTVETVNSGGIDSLESLDTLWQNVQTAYDRGQWEIAIDEVLQIRSVDNDYERSQIDNLLFYSYVNLAAKKDSAGNLEGALSLVDKALEIRPEATELRSARSQVAKYLDALTHEGTEWSQAIVLLQDLYDRDPEYRDVRQRLIQAQIYYADALMADGEGCSAAIYYAGALKMGALRSIGERQARAEGQCAGLFTLELEETAIAITDTLTSGLPITSTSPADGTIIPTPEASETETPVAGVLIIEPVSVALDLSDEITVISTKTPIEMLIEVLALAEEPTFVAENDDGILKAIPIVIETPTEVPRKIPEEVPKQVLIETPAASAISIYKNYTATLTTTPTLTKIPTLTPTQLSTLTPTLTPTPQILTPTELPTQTSADISTQIFTETPTQTSASTQTSTPVSTQTPTPVSTQTSTPVSTPTQELKLAPIQEPKLTPTQAFSETPTPVSTWTSVPIPQWTLPPIDTLVPTWTAWPTSTSIFTNTPTSVPTGTAIPTSTAIPRAVPTHTPTHTPAHTLAHTPTHTPVHTPIHTFTPTLIPTETPIRIPTHGRILYGAVSAHDGRSRVHALPLDPNQRERIWVDDGKQPGLRGDGQRLAYINTRGDLQGVNTHDPATGMRLRFTNLGKDRMPSWNYLGNRIVFDSRREVDRVSRIYVKWATPDSPAVLLGFGEQPMWHPSQDRIAFRGCDRSGNRCGLWAMDGSGESQSQLTAIPEDAFPTWTPDGYYLIFMSYVRDGNYEIYRLSTDSGEVLRLTDDPAQDGIPAVSPDGDWILFLSNRNGAWGFWVVPINGGAAHPVGNIRESIGDWMDQRIQWVP